MCSGAGDHSRRVVVVVSVQWFGSEALELTYKTPTGKVANELLYRHDEPRLELVEQGRPWGFDGDGALFQLVSEAQRIRLAHLFDPVLAVHTSVVEPLPHQITAVYESMLPRQPLRFLLADDPGAGKTITAGLFIKELIARGDLQRCLIVCPGSLAEQWQDELYRRFHLPFEILTNDKLEAAHTGNWFLETNLVIARLDKLSRNESVQQKLQAPDARWDLVVCDEAHKMSATLFGGEIKYTKRYRLGQLLSTLTRHFLLMTATPHNGKEADFQLFMALLDGDRFEGRFRDEVHGADVSDLMRRMVKENLLKFDGTALFPERIAYTAPTSSRRPRPTSTRRSPSTFARSSTAPRLWRTTSGRGPWALHSPSCNGGSPPRLRRFSSRCGGAANGLRAGYASSRCSSAGARPRRSWRPPSPLSTSRTSRTLKTRRTMKSRPLKRRSSTRRPRRDPWPSSKSK